MTEKMIRDAYCRIRTIDQTIPDEVLDFIKDSAIEKLRNSSVGVGLPLDKMAIKLDEALAKETPETLTKFISDKRSEQESFVQLKSDLSDERLELIAKYVYPDFEPYTDSLLRRGFVAGIKYGRKQKF